MGKGRGLCSGRGWLVAVIIGAVLVIDQAIKIAVKTGMYMHERIRVTDWFYIYFTENRGMAFGMEFFSKLSLTSFRIIVVGAILFYLVKLVRRKAPKGFIICMSLIVAGALGNIIDSVFYGMIFNNPPAPMVAEFVPWGMGYEKMLYGRVVDMFYFPLIESTWPSWVPWVGGESFVFFSPIFNFADAAISCGIIALLLFYHKRLSL
ncbi:MAG: lipoprotein signal peptidase [Paraprevotella sp.]|nr:lipoprotein signal peptidase [Paraprevotella sp.]